MDEQDVTEFVSRCQQLIDASPQMDEENTKAKLIRPFLELLGWDFFTTEVSLEYTVTVGSGNAYVDYALLIGDAPKVFVEAKSVNSRLTDSELQQLQSYMRQELDVDWGILTNGQSFEVLAKSQNGSGEISVAEFSLDDLAQNPDMLEILTKDAIRSGEAGEVAEQIARTNQAIQEIRQQEDAVVSSVVESVEDVAGTVLVSLEDHARAFVQDLISGLQEQREFVSNDVSPTTTDDGESDERSGPQSSQSRVAGRISPAEIDGDPDARVAVFPTKESGLQFLKENEAWGFVRVGREIEYVAMYVTGDVGEIKYFATANAVVEPEEADLVRDPEEYQDAKIADGRKVIEFEEGSLYELDEPIPFESKYPQGIRYTTLGQIRTADTTDDVL